MKFSEVNWLSRKLIGSVVLFAAITTFLLIGKADVAQWMDFNKWIFLIYGAGNAISKFSSK